MNKHSLLITIASLIIASSLVATDFVMISDLGSSARSIALGNVDGYNTAADAVFSNPAALTNTSTYSVSLFSSKLMNDVHYFNAAISAKTAYGTFAAGIYEQAVTGIASTSRINHQIAQTGSYAYKNTQMKLSYQTDLSSTVSVAATYTHYTVAVANYSGAGSNIDAGILASFNSFKLSVLAQNIVPNQSVSFSHGNKEQLPFSLSSTAIISFKNITLLPQIKLSKNNILFSQGISYTPSFLTQVTLHAGYKQKLDYLSQKHANLSLGASLNLLDLNIHVAYERSDYILMDHNMYASFSYGI
tara:strand:- start:22 stop:927 length:906 start_codon:yes stop_codon:yes gene_type:complete